MSKSSLTPVQLLVHILCMFGLGILWFSTAGIIIMNPKIATGLCWEVKVLLLLLVNEGKLNIGMENGLNFGSLFTIWGIISRYWWISIAPTLSVTYLVISRKK